MAYHYRTKYNYNRHTYNIVAFYKIMKMNNEIQLIKTKWT